MFLSNVFDPKRLAIEKIAVSMVSKARPAVRIIKQAHSSSAQITQATAK
jgi:hypothetical protein